MTTIAYVDPGLGLLAWQALIAFFVGLLFYLKKTRDWIVTQFQRLFRFGAAPQPKKATETAESREFVGK